MANILFLGQPFVSVGLDDYTHTIAADGDYTVRCQLTENPPTGLSVVVNKNGGPIFTAPVITPTQIAQQFEARFKAVATDVITVVLASVAPVDLELNTVKTTVSIDKGL